MRRVDQVVDRVGPALDGGARHRRVGATAPVPPWRCLAPNFLAPTHLRPLLVAALSNGTVLCLGTST
eukprot:scaffold19235_cov126-Isochrysis_galbana.AAC.15